MNNVSVKTQSVATIVVIRPERVKKRINDSLSDQKEIHGSINVETKNDTESNLNRLNFSMAIGLKICHRQN